MLKIPLLINLFISLEHIPLLINQFVSNWTKDVTIDKLLN